MRPGQQNKRGRGRSGGSGRKNGNPLSRTYDSTGPDVKIRGTAQHIADKYAALARDALGAGDTVMAENYLQHAEHYNRIIAAAQAAMQERYQREERENRDQPTVESGEPAPAAASAPPIADNDTTEAVVDANGPQPVISGTPVEIAMEEENAPQPQRRQSTRRRAPVRQRRPRSNSTEVAGAEEAPAEASEKKVSASDHGTAAVEAPDSVAEVAAAPSEA